MEHAELEDIAVAYIVIFDKPMKLNLASIRDESSFMKVTANDESVTVLLPEEKEEEKKEENKDWK